MAIYRGKIESKEIVDWINNFDPKKDQPKEYNQLIIDGDLDLSESNLPKVNGKILITCPIIITNSKITGKVNFSNITFKNKANFLNTVFKEKSKFLNSEFNQMAIFKESIFENDIDFSNTHFKYANFEMAKFDSSVDFRKCIFEGDADFFSATFRVSADFPSAKFKRDAKFWRAKFKSSCNFTDAQFSELSPKAGFPETEFVGFADFRGAIFYDEADFLHSHFYTYANFEGSKFIKSAVFIEVKFNGYADFKSSLFKGQSYFRGSQFDRIAYFDGSNFDSSIDLTKVRSNLIRITWNSIKEAMNNADDASYLMLINNYKALGWYEDADNCYYEYRKWRLNSTLNHIPLIAKAKGLSNSCCNKYKNYTKKYRNNKLAVYIRSNLIKLLGHLSHILIISKIKKFSLNKLDSATSKLELLANKSVSYTKILIDKIRIILTIFIEFSAKISYGYSVKPEYPIFWSIFVILIFGAIFCTGNWDGNGLEKYTILEVQEISTINGSQIFFKQAYVKNENISLFDNFLFSLSTFTSGFTSFITPDTEFRARDFYKIIAILERIFGSLLIALFITSFGKRIVR